MAVTTISENISEIFFEDNSTNRSNLSIEIGLDLTLYGKIFAGLDLCLAPFIIGGNTLVLIAVCYERKLHTVPNAFIASLAVADLLVGLLTIPLYVLFYLQVAYVENNKYVCLIRCGMALLSCGSSLMNLLLMSFDRYLAVLHPLRYHALMTPGRAKLALVVLWVFSTFISFVPLTGWNAWTDNSPCDLYAVLAREHIYIAVHFVVLGCLTLTTSLYIRIFYTAHSHRKQIKATCMFTAAATRRRDKEFKSAKVMSLVLLLFVLFWMPYISCSALKFIDSVAWDLVEVVKSFALCLSLSNSMMNPVVYAFLKKDFRQVFKKYLFSHFRCCKGSGMTNAQNILNLSEESSSSTGNTYLRDVSTAF